MGASISKGKQNQVIGTPWEFMDALKKRFGNITFDLAATKDNAKADKFFTEEDNALAQDWPRTGLCYLNPPFAHVTPWVKKAKEEGRLGTSTIMLVRASITARWFWDHVMGEALIIPLGPERITFIGSEKSYPSGLMLICYGPRFGQGMAKLWSWQNDPDNWK